MSTTIRLGGRTAYSLAWRRDGERHYTRMTVLGPRDPEKAVAAVLADRTLADWATMRHAGLPVLVALGGAEYPLAPEPSRMAEAQGLGEGAP